VDVDRRLHHGQDDQLRDLIRGISSKWHPHPARP
jgi:hypothetical protein